MPPFSTIERIEVKDTLGGHSEAKAVEMAAAPFVKPLAVESTGSQFQVSPDKGLEGFISIGQRGPRELEDFTQRLRETSPNDLEMSLPVVADGPASDSARSGPPPITGFRSLLQNVAYYFKAALGGGFGGLGGPFMIFGFMLRNGERLEINNASEFEDVHHLYNEKLKSFDEAADQKRLGLPLTAEQEKILSNPDAIELDRQRTQLLDEYSHYHSGTERATHGESPMDMSFLFEKPEEMNSWYLETVKANVQAANVAPFTANIYADVLGRDGNHIYDEMISGVKLPGSETTVYVSTRALDAFGNEPTSIQHIHHYNLVVPTEAFEFGSYIILTEDRRLVAQIHQGFVEKLQETGSREAAEAWLLYQSPWAGKGLIKSGFFL